MILSSHALSLFYPMAAMVLLTFIVVVMLFRQRTGSVTGGLVSASYFKTYQGALEPERSIRLARHFSNLFEVPVLFYVACLSAMAIRIDSIELVVLAWAYVICRGCHAYIHIGRNRLRARINAYFAGWIVLLSMWAVLIVKVSSM